MSDQRTNILTAIDSALTILRAPGGALAGIKSHHVLFTSAEGPPDYGVQAPLLIVTAPDVESEDLTLCGTMRKKRMPVYFSLFTENNGDTTNQVPSELVDALETEFFNETFSYSSIVTPLSKSYSQTSIAEFSGKWAGFSELVLEYLYIDGVSGMYNTLPYVSGILECDGTTSIPVNYTSIRVKSDGGTVKMTALPVFSPAPMDGKIFVVVGQDDSAMLEFPDETDTPGSGLRMINARNMYLGKNDSLVFQYDASQAVFINLSRSDSY